jgi:hypothetical protein
VKCCSAATMCILCRPDYAGCIRACSRMLPCRSKCALKTKTLFAAANNVPRRGSCGSGHRTDSQRNIKLHSGMQPNKPTQHGTTCR